MGPMMPGVYHAPYADCYRCPVGASPDNCAAECVNWIEDQLFLHLVSPDEVAALVVEPIQGEGGYVIPPKQFHDRLRSLTKQHGILLVADEVQSGMGRTGRMFACEHFGLEPDMLNIAKGIASGMPLGITVARADIMSWPPGTHASTFGGNPVSCAAALATIKLLREQLVKNAEVVGEYLLDRLRELADKHPLIGDVRGKGLMIGVELVRDRTTKARAVKERDAVLEAMFGRGVLILGAGPNTVRFAPPLVLSKEQAESAVTIFDDALTEVEQIGGARNVAASGARA
jgi:4-aminobutyrate aminotransferase